MSDVNPSKAATVENLAPDLTDALNDPVLPRLPISVGWEWLFAREGVSDAGWRLARQLRDPAFNFAHEKMFHASFGSQMRVNEGLLATWLVRRALDVGVDETLSGLKDYLACNGNPVIHVVALQGLEIDQGYDLGNNRHLLPLKDIPDSIQKEIFAPSQDAIQRLLAADAFHYLPHDAFIYAPRVAIVQTAEVTPKSSEPDDSDLQAVPFSFENDLIWLLTALLSDGGAPTSVGSWQTLQPWVPFSGICDTGYQYAVERRKPKAYTHFTNDDVTRIRDLLGYVSRMRTDLADIIKTSLERLSSSMNTSTQTERAIDLGIALEALLCRASKGQLSYQFRTVGALLTGDTLSQRQEHAAIYKAVYDLRSMAVHNGRFDGPKIKVGARGRIQVSQILKEGTDLAQEALRRAIRMGGLSAEAAERLVLSLEDIRFDRTDFSPNATPQDQA